MDTELVHRLEQKLVKRWNRESFSVQEVVDVLDEHNLTRRQDPRPSTITAKDKERLEKVREQDIARRVAEENGIIGGMREHFTIAFLLNYIDKMEGRSPE